MAVLCDTIRRVVGPLQVVLGASLREADVAKQLALAGVITSKPASLVTSLARAPVMPLWYDIHASEGLAG